MLFPKENQPVSETPAAPVHSAPPSSGSGIKIPILFGAVLALVGASVYLFYELKQVRQDLDTTRESLLAEIAKVHETSTVSTQTSKRAVDSLKSEVDDGRRVPGQLAG